MPDGHPTTPVPMTTLAGQGVLTFEGIGVPTATAPFPIPYQGSKRKLANQIIACFPSDATQLFEPFCGAAAVSLAAIASGEVAKVFLNDTNEPLTRLWRRIIDTPDALANGYEDLWNAQLGRERPFYDEVRTRFNGTGDPVAFLYLLARCVKAAVRYNSQGEFNQSPDNRRKGAQPDRMRDHIMRASDLLRNRAVVTSMDYANALADTSREDIVYMDPPYQGVSTNRDRRYRDVLALGDFADVLEELNRRSISFIVSYDGSTGKKVHGDPLPRSLNLAHFGVPAGRSTQATFLGDDSVTVESLYLSPALIARLGQHPTHLELAKDMDLVVAS